MYGKKDNTVDVFSIYVILVDFLYIYISTIKKIRIVIDPDSNMLGLYPYLLVCINITCISGRPIIIQGRGQKDLFLVFFYCYR